MRFIGREEEILKIKNKINSDKQENILVFGRRRIGKSFLIKKSIEDINCIKLNYQCKKIKIEATIEEITRLINSELKLNNKFSSFDEILDFLFSYNKKIIFIIDEYPYLTEELKGVDSIIQSYIDKYKFDSELKLIISGSAISIMRDMIDYSMPLFGRFTEVIELKEQNYLDSSKYYDNYSYEDKIAMFSVLGGEPYYNSLVNYNNTFEENIIDLIIKENSIIELTLNNRIFSELNKVSYALDVMQLIALGVCKNDDILSKSHIESSARLATILNKLLKLDIIEKKAPINDEFNKKKTFYYLKSNVLKFYFKYVFKNLSIRNNMNEITFYEKFIKEDLYSKYIPKQFEKICYQFLILSNKNNKIDNPFHKIGTYWYNDKQNKINGEFDIVTIDDTGTIFYEVKYTNKKIEVSDIEEELKQLSTLKLDYYKLGFFSKTGFSNDIDDNYKKYELHDLFNI